MQQQILWQNLQLLKFVQQTSSKDKKAVEITQVYGFTLREQEMYDYIYKGIRQQTAEAAEKAYG